MLLQATGALFHTRGAFSTTGAPFSTPDAPSSAPDAPFPQQGRPFHTRGALFRTRGTLLTGDSHHHWENIEKPSAALIWQSLLKIGCLNWTGKWRVFHLSKVNSESRFASRRFTVRREIALLLPSSTVLRWVSEASLAVYFSQRRHTESRCACAHVQRSPSVTTAYFIRN